MKTTHKRAALLLALCMVTAIGGHALLNDHHERVASNSAKQHEAQLFDCQGNGGTPVSIVLTSGTQTLTLRRNHDAAASHDAPTQWQITSPIEASADDTIVDGFISAACAIVSESTLEAKAHEPALDLALFHLKPPQHIITFAWNNDSTTQVAVGDVSGFNNKLYVQRLNAEGIEPSAERLQAQPVEQINNALTHHLQREVNAWREKRPLVGVNSHDIEQVDVAFSKAGSAHYTVAAQPNGSYVLTVSQNKSGSKKSVTPQTLPADAVKVREWLSAIVDARAEQFVAQAPNDAERKRFAMQEPQTTVTLRLRDGAVRTLVLGQLKLGTQQHLFAQGHGYSGPIVRLTANTLWQQLTDGSKDLEDMRVLHVELSDVLGVTIEQDGHMLRYKRTEATNNTPGVWHLVSQSSDAVAHAASQKSAEQNTPQAIDQQAFVTALTHLLHMRAAEVITRHATAQDLQQGKLTSPKYTITLSSEDDRPLSILWLGHNSDGKTLITDDQKEVIWRVFEGTAEAFSLNPESFITPKSEPATPSAKAN